MNSISKESHSRRIRIGLFLGARPFDGGLFQYSQAILAAVLDLQRKGYDVSICYQFAEWEKHLSFPGVRTFKLSNGVFSKLLRWVWKKLKLDIDFWRFLAPYIHGPSRELLAEGCTVWIFPGQDEWTYFIPVPAIGVVHDLMHRYEGRFPELGAPSIYAYRERHFSTLVKYAKLVITDSELGRKQVAESYDIPIEKTAALPYVPPNYIVEAHQADVDFELRYKLPRRFLFYPAQFWLHKNHLALLRVAHSLREELHDLAFVFCGSLKNGSEEILKYRDRYGLHAQILILDYVPEKDLPEFYRRAVALVMPTFLGPTNIPPLEAFVLGCPVILSNTYGMPEQCQGAALLVDPASDEEIRFAIKRIWTEPGLVDELREKGLARSARWAQEHFNQRLMNIVEGVLSDLDIKRSN